MSLSMRTVFSALVLRPLRREPGRTLLTILGIGVGVAVVVAIQLANRSAIRSFEETVDAVAGRANYQLTASAGTMNQNLLLELQPFWSKGVRFAPVIDRDAVLTNSSRPVRILAVDLLSDLHFRDYRFARVAGSDRDAPGAVQSWYLALFANRSAIVPAPLASRLGLRIGNRVPVTLDGSSSTFVIRATLESEGPATAFDGAIMIMDIHVAQTSFPELEGKLSRIDLIVPDEDPRILESIRSILPRGVELERPSRRAERVDQMLQAFRVNLIALASVSLIVGIFLVYNTVLVSVLRRRGMIGTMRTLGVGSIQIFLSFLFEGLLFGLLGSIAGLGIGLYLARGILDLVSRTVSTLYVRTAPSAVELTPDVVLTAVITGAVVALLAALQPAAEAARVRPLTLLRESRFARLRPRRITFMALGGTVCLVTAWFVSKLPPAGSISIGGYGAVLFVIIGFSLLSPLALQKLALLAKKPLRRLFSVPGELAAASMPASLRRTAIAAAALLIAIAMMVAVSLMIGSFRSTVNTWVEQTVSSDIWLRPARNLDSAAASFPEQITRDLEKLDFVEAWDFTGVRFGAMGVADYNGDDDADVVVSGQLSVGGLQMRFLLNRD
ncbi:MAG: FtsX-like permease family protein, partial [Acidobacteria bacterium]|nr:FtsX-like permease family protein [Acidobacteriota bacterium]